MPFSFSVFWSPMYLYFYISLILTTTGLTYSSILFYNKDYQTSLYLFFTLLAWWSKSPIINFEKHHPLHPDLHQPPSQEPQKEPQALKEVVIENVMETDKKKGRYKDTK